MLTDYSKENLPLFVFLIFCIFYSFVSSSIIAFHKIQTLSRKIQAWFVLNFILLVSAIIMIIKFGVGSNLSILLFSLWFGLTLSIYFWYMNSDNKILKMKARLALSNVCIVILCFIVLCIVFLYQDAKLVQINNEKNRTIQNEKTNEAIDLAHTCSTSDIHKERLKRDPFVCFQPIIALSLRDKLLKKDEAGNYVVIEYDKDEVNNMIDTFINYRNDVFRSDPENEQKIQDILDESLNFLNEKLEDQTIKYDLPFLKNKILDYSNLIAEKILYKAQNAEDFNKFLNQLDNFNYHVNIKIQPSVNLE